MTNNAKLDPRFRRAPKKATKVVVDERFQGMFTEADFVAPVRVDKYGRKVQSDREKRDLARFYRLEDDEEAAGGASPSEKDGEAVAGRHAAPSESYSDSESSTSEGEAIMDEILSEHPLVLRDVPTGEATRRLALVNLDWDQIRADDIYTVLHGFKPITGIIHSVTVYPSRFGKERMRREAMEGPARELFAQDDESPASEDSPSEQEQELDEAELDAEVEEELRIKDQDDQEDRESIALRKYQLERLRYYYAVVECDSVATASHIYRHCDGSEFEKSTNFLDLRFIPDHVTFTSEEDGPIRDVALELPKNYHPKPELATAALQKSRVALTWDADDAERVRIMHRPRRGMDLAEEDLRAYLASGTDGETEDEETATGGKSGGAMAVKYRELLLGDGKNGAGPDEAGVVYGRKSGRAEQLKITFTSGLKSSAQAGGNDDDEDDVHMEAQFHLSEGEEGSTDNDEGEDHGRRKAEDKTPFQRYLERRKAKKEARKLEAKEAKEASVAESKSQRKKRRVAEREQRAVESERLSLLLDRDAEEDDDDGAMRRGRHRQAGSGKGKKSRKDTGGAIDLEDPRFAAVFEESSYALDPSHPSFRRTKATDQLIKERQKRLHQRS